MNALMKVIYFQIIDNNDLFFPNNKWNIFRALNVMMD